MIVISLASIALIMHFLAPTNALPSFDTPRQADAYMGKKFSQLTPEKFQEWKEFVEAIVPPSEGGKTWGWVLNDACIWMAMRWDRLVALKVYNKAELIAALQKMECPPEHVEMSAKFLIEVCALAFQTGMGY